MNNTELLRQLREPPSEARAHWHRAMRLVRSRRSSDDGKSDWESADLDGAYVFDLGFLPVIEE